MYRARTLLGCIDMGYKRTGRPCHDSEHYADGKSMKTLTRYLCTMAKPEGSGHVMVDMCRICESQCEYGKRYIKLYDLAEAEKQAGKKPSPKKAVAKKPPAKPKAPPTVTTILQETQKAERRHMGLPAMPPKTNDGGAHTWQPLKAATS